MKKLNMKSRDNIKSNIEFIQGRFPDVIKEGSTSLEIDFEALKQELSSELLDDKKEKYEMTWPGKRKAKLEINIPTQKTLRPIKEKSVNFDKTENLYIEGDNLEVLKILQESYLNKIKCIYIDPPYNTGNDFIYKDNFDKKTEEELLESGQIDDLGNRLITNRESRGRYHSDWLSMMYPRLKLARDLLAEDGILFVSIDENENSNLRKICDEIFGETNFNGEIVWKNKFGSGAMTAGFIGVHEYVLCYSKNKLKNITRALSTKEIDQYNKTKDEKFDERGGYVTQPLAVSTFDKRPSLIYPIFYKDQEIWPNKQWVWSKDRMMKAIDNNDVVFNKQKDGSYNLRSKKYLIDEEGNMRRGKPTTFFTEVYTQNGTKDMRELFGKVIFEYTKPVEFIKHFVGLETNNNSSKDSIILDFFSGSATTAHAVMELNAEDGGNRKYIMVQLDEKTEEKSEAYKAGYRYITEIGQERIRRAAKKIKEETNADIDYGFRVYKLDSSNMKEVYYRPDEFDQSQLDVLEENIKEDRTDLDVLTQVMLDLGLTLDLKIEEKEIKGQKVYFVENNNLVASFSNINDLSVVDEMCKNKPLKLVFRESSFNTDKDKINLQERVKKLSPETEISIL